MSIGFGFHPLSLVLALLLAGLLTWWTYRRTTPTVSTARRSTLIGLRWATLGLVLLLLAEPVVRTILRVTQTPIVAVLFDTSRSLSSAVHPGKDFSSAFKQSYTEIIAAAERAQIDSYRFGSRIEAWTPTADTIAFDGARTDIATALESLRDQYIGRPLRAVVVLSDGRYNWGSNPIYVAEQYPVPIHTVVVGDTTTYRDVWIARVVTNDVGYVDREMPVQVVIHAKGFEGRNVSVALSNGDAETSRTQVMLPESESEVAVDLGLVPSVEGFHRFEASVDVLDGERTPANNRTSFSVRVLRRRLSILFIAGAPSPDVAALREMLQADPDLEVEPHTQKSSSRWYEESPPPASLDRFDVVLLAGYPGRLANPAILEAVAAANRPILFFMDRTTDLQMVRDKLGSALPVSVRTIREGFNDVSAIATPDGRSHPVLDFSGELRRLPPLSYPASRWEATPDAHTLATVAMRGVTLDEPLIVVRSRGGTRSAAVLGAGVWRWKNVPDDLADLDDVFPTLVSNLLQWVTTTSDDRPVQVRPVEQLFDGADAVQFVGEILDESLKPVGDASVVLSITDTEGTTFDYRMESVGSGRYSRGIGRLPEGTYRYHAFAERNGTAIGADSGRFAVGELLLEFQDARADFDLMRQIARRSGGVFVSQESLETLGETLTEAQTFTEEAIEEERQYPLRRFLPLLFLIVALLSAEWIIRKRSGMV